MTVWDEETCVNDDDDGLRHCLDCENAWKSLDGEDACPFCGEQRQAMLAVDMLDERNRAYALLRDALQFLPHSSVVAFSEPPTTPVRSLVAVMADIDALLAGTAKKATPDGR